ncbi:hypothetical protein D7V93_42030 [Corallococcus llansteffanensis]|uniref:Serine/threonine protein kinase n=1 Tax=Corallococcus llansteffanensis TaxID=2316731 RepID=A0A3A8N1R9_9BACT|nr:hypothetical protein D7V93_42030 [Corallococcus llansteffanensis]
MAPVHATATDAPPPSALSRLRTPLIIGAGVVLVGAVVAAVFMPGGGVEIVNAQDGERVYVSGIRLEEDRTLPPSAPAGSLLVATAVDGQLHRFGKVMQTERIDLRTLADAAPPPDSTGTLSVTGPTGCRVALGKQLLEGTTPLASRLPAGREFEVRITCGNRPDVVRWVMAVPGQGVALDVP